MIKQFVPTLLIVGLALLHFLLFWEAGSGLNQLIFSVLALGVLFFLRREEWENPALWVVGIGNLVSAIMIVVHHSAWAHFVHFFSFVLLLGFLQHRELRFLWFGLLLGIFSLFRGPFLAFRQIQQKWKPSLKLPDWHKLLLYVVPFFLLGSFFLLYALADSSFTRQLTAFAEHIIDHYLSNFVPEQLLFFVWSTIVALALVLRTSSAQKWVFRQQPDTIVRTRKSQKWKHFMRPLALKTEYQSALLSLGLLNGLLLLVNLFDLPFFWMNYAAHTSTELSTFVHAGTYVLIFSILAAMGVILYYFRKNLNFFPDNSLLKALAIAWCVQNAFLAFSIGFRNLQYILQMGLAYKRIAVLFFLLLVLFGLWTVIRKVKDRKSLFALFNWNGWALYAVLLATSCINWDVFVTRYNLSQTSHKIDISFLLYEVSDKNYFLLKEHQPRLLKNLDVDQENFILGMKNKENSILYRQQDSHWKNWNWADQKNFRLLSKSEK
ncbi:MAG: DUF4173 domain-containing protein [Saprospiraceae bacterium]|nr:DUF4173 domain-containing protein [Saprospiraceae bacterium]